MLVASLSILYYLRMQRPGNPKTSVVYHGALSYMQHLTSRQLKTYTHPLLPYITIEGSYK